MARKALGTDVFNMAIDRMAALYREGHRIVVSFSAGKDSTCALNICKIAARETGRLPVEVVLQEEEIAWPGTYEYAERVAKDPEVSFTWLVMQHPMVNIFNRQEPYWWVCDPLLKPEQWVRQPPPFAQFVKEKEISMMTVPWRFPPPEGKNLYAVIGLRVEESRGRMYGIFSSGGYITKPNKFNVSSVRPIYDWKDTDVWKAIKDNGWDYNRCYDTLYAAGIRGKALRVGPPTMTVAGVGLLQKAAAAWPLWFRRVADRLPGVRVGAQFGLRAVTPSRRLGETWEQCFQRECIDRAPQWIAERATLMRDRILTTHSHHSTAPFPEKNACYTCVNHLGSWKNMAMAFYNGDPFSLKCSGQIPWVEPEFFRPGAGKWIVSPSM